MALRPLNSQNSLPQNFGQINDMVRQLNNEQTTKVFKQAGGNAIVEGKLPYDGGYGSLYYDASNKPRILIGITPDGDVDIVKSKAGTSVLDVFN
jgi:hypothetical protein